MLSTDAQTDLIAHWFSSRIL